MYVYSTHVTYDVPHAHKTVSTEIATLPQSTKSRHSDLSVSRGTNSSWDFGLIWICTEKFEFLDVVDFGGIAFLVESVMCHESHASFTYRIHICHDIPHSQMYQWCTSIIISTTSRNSNSSVQIQIKPKSQLEFVPRDTERSACLDLVEHNLIMMVVRMMHINRHS